MDRLFTSGPDAPGYEPELSWRFADSSFMKQWLNTQALRPEVHFLNQHRVEQCLSGDAVEDFLWSKFAWMSNYGGKKAGNYAAVTTGSGYYMEWYYRKW